MIAPVQHLLEQPPRLLRLTDQMQPFDEPEGAEVERCLGQSEIVRSVVAHHEGAAPQVLLDRLQGVVVARIVGVQEAEVDQLGEAGV